MSDEIDAKQRSLASVKRARQKEIKNATKTSLSLGKKIYDVSHKDFPLKELSSKLNKIQNQLDGGLGFVLLRNLPVEYFNDEEVKFMLWGIGQHIGYPEVQDKAGSLIHVVTDTGSSVNKTDNISNGQENTNTSIKFGCPIGAVLPIFDLGVKESLTQALVCFGFGTKPIVGTGPVIIGPLQGLFRG